MITIRVPDMRDGYVELVRRILAEGREVRPRGMRTLELPEPTAVVLDDPRDCFPLGVGREPSLKIAAAEAAHLLGGVSNADQLVRCAKSFAQFVEQDRLRGAYGPRAHAQWPRVVESLRKDPDSRQATLTVWNGGELDVPSKDVPCTLSLSYQVRDGKLRATTVMRSNDVFWGVPYDFFFCCAAQRMVARALDLPLGTYTHVALSMHAYVDRDADKLDALRLTGGTADPPPEFLPERLPVDNPASYLNRVRSMAVGAVRDVPWTDGPAGDYWLRNVLEGTRDSDWVMCDRCRYFLPPERFVAEGCCDRCAP